MEEAEETADRQLRLLEEDYRRTIMAGRQRSREEEEDTESRDALANGYHAINGGLEEGEEQDEQEGDEDDGESRPVHAGYQTLDGLNDEASDEDEDEDEEDEEAACETSEQEASMSASTSDESGEERQRVGMSEEDKECIRNAMSNIDMQAPEWARDIDNAVILQQVNRLLAANNLGHLASQ
uniref:Uncharacterized protein n=1 Tax=Guillardia theta TaxID=55529 RepID=A0A7S4KKH7_GUITH